MLEADAFLEAARRRGFDFYSGVPCSFLAPLIDRAISNRELAYVGAASEGEAVAVAAGAWLAGRRAVVMCQNSGLANAVNPLTSLAHPFRIPLMLIVTWRGAPNLGDAPQHELMGKITQPLLDVIRVDHHPFPREADGLEAALDAAEAAMARRELPFAFVMEKGSVRGDGPNVSAPHPRPVGRLDDRRGGGEQPARADVLEQVLDLLPEQAAVIATTGKCGRELFTLADRRQHFYQVGSMGCAAPLGLGVALGVERPVVVLDGDGATLMKLGALATIGAYAPTNLIHVVLDNGVHDSTGGQPTVSASVDFAAAAIALGYAGAAACDDSDSFESAFARALETLGPHLLHARIRPGSMGNLGRPTQAPPELARRFRSFLAED